MKYKIKSMYLKIKKSNIVSFFQLFESKLDVVIFRSNIISNLFRIQKLIKTGRILINNQIITNINYLVKRGDIIKLNLNISEKKKSLKKLRLIFKFFFRFKLKIIHTKFFPKHLEINYKTLTILYLNDILKLKDIYFPISLNLNIIKRFFLI